MGSDSNVWHQVHAQREDGVAAMFLIRDVQPRTDQPKIFVVELPYAVTDLSGQPDAAAYRRLSAFQEQWLEPACAALGWTFVAWKCEDGSFFLYLYGAGDPDALLEKLAPFDGELGFFNDVDADWSEYAALRELVEQAESDSGHDGYDHDHDHDHDHVHVHTDGCDHDHDTTALEIPVVELAGEPVEDEHTADDALPEPPGQNGKSRSIAAGSEAEAATHRPLPRAVPVRAGRAGRDERNGSPARSPGKRAAAATRTPAQRTAARKSAGPRPRPSAQPAAARPAAARPAAAGPAAARPAKRAAPAKPVQRATAKPVKRAAATRSTKRAAPPTGRREAAKPRRSR